MCFMNRMFFVNGRRVNVFTFVVQLNAHRPSHPEAATPLVLPGTTVSLIEVWAWSALSSVPYQGLLKALTWTIVCRKNFKVLYLCGRITRGWQMNDVLGSLVWAKYSVCVCTQNNSNMHGRIITKLDGSSTWEGISRWLTYGTDRFRVGGGEHWYYTEVYLLLRTLLIWGLSQHKQWKKTNWY